MARFDEAVAISVISVSGFQLLQAWNNNAPSLATIRSAHRDDPTVRQQLYDADFMVGGIALILGISFAILTHDNTALIVMLLIFGVVSLWHHSVLNAQPI